ncbi:uncharacterized protein BDV17DRAFT_294150 [Aspergillus undulatus]|uniref:uncharacterized protein n=1 Tax=Aspergillus undulatus TaxID=1810928 RepID=UPI003CCCB0DC
MKSRRVGSDADAGTEDEDENEDEDEDTNPKATEPRAQKQNRPAVPSPVPSWLVNWIQTHAGEVVSFGQVEELVGRIQKDIDSVGEDGGNRGIKLKTDVRFPDVEILPVFRDEEEEVGEG